ncbi:MAG: SDR family oxidoreductase [Myxococcales bacterium]|nr:SDR family oxidoreductase [Myxococcales bacterium]MCB9650104.1 SDR family oxidoreductase [Deltaproteobacteria bacterium]
MKVALVTAGAHGLGGHLTRHLLQAGFHVIAHWHHRPSDLAHPALTWVQADLTQASGREALVDAARGRLDVLVNNLGVYPEARLEDTDLALWSQTLELTLTANFHLTQLAAPLLTRPGGRVINLGDSGADRIEARRQATPYHVAKLGVHVLTRTFAQVLGPDGITVNMVSPGFLENSVGEPGEPIPAGRPGAFEDIAAAVDFLLGDGAAYTSGTNLLVNGAWNLG